MSVDGNRVKLAIWDTAGQERFRTLTPSYYRGAQGIIFGLSNSSSLIVFLLIISQLFFFFSVYDVTNRSTMERLDHWLTETETYCTKGDAVRMVVANKIDMVKVVK